MGWKEKIGELKSKYEDYRRKRRSREEEKLKERYTKAQAERRFLEEKGRTIEAEEKVKKIKESQFKKSTAGKFIAAAAKMDFAGTTAPYFAGYSYSQHRKRRKKKAKTTSGQPIIIYAGAPPKPIKKAREKRRKKTTRRARSIWDL